MKSLLRTPQAQAILASLLSFYLTFALRTTRWTLDGQEHFRPHGAGAPAVFAFWHEFLPLMPALSLIARKLPFYRPTPIHTLVSQHRDGQFIGAVVRRFGILPILGSSTRGGATGTRNLLGVLRKGELIGITPDGPRGPRRQAAFGVAQLAALSGVPVVPLAARTTRRVHLDTWDRMPVPLPFGRGVMVCGPAIHVPRHDWKDAIPAITEALNEAAARADLLCTGMNASFLATGWTVATTLLAPAIRANLHRRVRTGREIAERLPERFGIDPTPRPSGLLLWMHAASVGETTSILPVLDALRHRAKVLLTTGTATSQALLDQRIPEHGLSGHVLHRFAPLDVPSWVGRFLSHWQPDAGCFVESELWPNQLAACHSRGIKLMLLNARMSDRSFVRWRLAPRFACRVLDGFSLIQARGDQDAERLRALGATHVDSPGDLKFAAPPLPMDAVELDRLKGILGDRPVWLAASTHPGEESLIARVHRSVTETHPGLLTIIAPRHPERGPALSAELNAPRRAAGQDPPQDAGIWIADTMGELGLWYRLAPIAFVGRSLIRSGGGQNPLEPARLGCCIAVGPYTGNFIDHVALLRDAGGLVDVADAAGLARFVSTMLDNAEQRRLLGQRAAEFIRRYSDLPARSAEALLSLLPGA